jgi:hypothetical protein
MKTITTILSVFLISSLSAQINPVDFEAGGNGADWTWTVFENDTNPPLEIVANPDPTGINTSATVAKFTALVTGMPFAGCETMHGSDIGTFTLSTANAFVSIKVWKTEISDVGIKFATFPGASTGELKVPNTLVNQWEELIFDFTSIIGEPSSTDIDQLIVFPDFQARTGTNVIYFDDIIFGDSTLGVSENQIDGLQFYPNPATQLLNINANNRISEIAIFNQIGQRVLFASPDQTTTALDISMLSSGMFMVRITSESGAIQNKKLIKL